MLKIMQPPKNAKSKKRTLDKDRQVCLRIKRIYLDAIVDGSKTSEFRADNEYYNRLFLTPFNRLKLHYQSSRQIIVEVTNIKKIEFDGETMFELELGKILESVK